ncbi:MAG: flagellar biosynthesis protein FlhB [Planctomycetota bacterium]|nr:MAG: flagellar biosynthesis protein FlhB [Planctomycetota bacterium]
MQSDYEDRTEAPTPRRRQQARSRGQVPRSMDLTATATLLGGMLFLGWWGPKVWLRLVALVGEALGPGRLVEEASPAMWAAALAVEAGKLVWPMFAAVVAVVLAVLWGQVGWLLTGQPLSPNLGKLNPLNGLKRLVSGGSGVSLLTSVAKVSGVGIVAYVTVMAQISPLLLAMTMSVEDVVLAGATLVYQLGVRLGIVLLGLGVADYVYQRFRHERQLRMTKQEVRDEFKSMDGDPVVRQRRRRMHLELMRQRLQHTVPKADLVITNPTHLSIALKYDSATMPAPKVVAKGEDELAMVIREIARRCGIPLVERQALARMMYPRVEVGEYIPERFYQAVAEVLAYVYRLTGKRAGAA